MTIEDSTGHNISMPIKFRCHHCRQFLGVSRAKAGSLADCPSCGRTIRIPQLDGKVEKVPAPAFNLNNTGLRNALDSLAQLAGPNVDAADVETYADDQAEMPVPRPEAEPSLPLVATTPKPIVEDFRSSAPEVESFLRHKSSVELTPFVESPSAESNGKAAPVDIEPAENRPASREADSLAPSMAALAKLAESPDAVVSVSKQGGSVAASQSSRHSSAPKTESPRNDTRHAPVTYRARSKSSLVLTSLISLCVGGAGGAFIMYSLSQRNEAAPTNPSNDSATESATPAAPAGPVGLQGRVNYIDQNGQSRPDAGSRVLVLPAERDGTALLPAEAFRSGSDEADRRIAEAAVAAMGGAFVTVNDAGEYSATLPSPTRFHVLILSQHLANDVQGDHAAELLADYVDRPSALLGRVAWTVIPIRHDGSGSQSVDHTFVSPQSQ